MRYALYVILCIFTTPAFAQVDTSAIDVDVVYPVQSQDSRIISLSGTVEAKQHAQLATLAPGLVSQLFVEVGDVVVKGQPLLSLNNRLAQLQVDSASASVQASNVNLAEAERLYQEVVALSKQQLVAKTLIAERVALRANAQAELARTQASLALQQEMLARHTLNAPFDGVIASRDIDVGEWVTQQIPVLTLVDQRHLRLTVAIPQEYYRYLAKAENVTVKVLGDTHQAMSIDATLSRFVPVSNSSNRTFAAQIDLVENDNFVAGMSARAEIEVPNSQQSMIILPLSAVKQHPDGGSSVFVLENGRAKRVITAYTNMQNGTVAISGQPFDKAYVVSGVEVLLDGSRVNATDVSASNSANNVSNSR